MADKAIIVGGGIVGLMTAYHLRQDGLDVTVLDRGDPGMGSSFGNAGWICPSLSAPLPGPGLVGRSLRWMLQRESPLYIAPAAVPRLTGWLRDFWRHCNARDNAAGLAAMLALNARTLALYDELQADGVDFEMHAHGVIVSFLDERELHAEYDDLRRVADHGFPPPQLLDREAVHVAEPALGRAVAGGVLLGAERHLEPFSLVRGVLRRLDALGVEVRPRVHVAGFARNHDAVRRVHTDEGSIAADLVVLAAGADTGALAAMLGARLPIAAGKGYSLTFPGMDLGVRHALYFGDTKVVLSQYDGGLRIAGTMEFSGQNAHLDPRRIEGVRSAAQRYLDRPLRSAAETVWTGMRPMTPDGLPAIGRLGGLANVFTATGHATNGVFMAPATGRALADVIVRGGCDVDLSPFDPARFGRR